MKLTNVTQTNRRLHHAFGPIGGGLFTRHRLARRWPEDGERMVTAAELRSFNLQI